MKLSSGFAAITFIAGLLAGLPLSVTANENPYENLIFCSNKTTGALRYTDGTKCKKKERRILVGMQGPQGPIGPEGPKGDPGPRGAASKFPLSFIQSNGTPVPFELLDFAFEGSTFLVDSNSKGEEYRLRTIRFPRFAKHYEYVQFTLYTDDRCVNPKYYSGFPGLLDGSVPLSHYDVMVVRTNQGWGYIDKLDLPSIYSNRDGLYQLSFDNSQQDYVCRAFPSGSESEFVKISRILPLPKLKFPLRWVATN